MGIPCMPLSPPVKPYHLNAIVYTSWPNASVSIAKCTPDRRTQKKPITPATSAGEDGGEQQRGKGSEARLHREEPDGIGPHAVEGHLAEGEQPGGPQKKVEGDRHQRRDQDLGQEVLVEPARDEGNDQQEDQRDQADRRVDGEVDRRDLLGLHAQVLVGERFHLEGSPEEPPGLDDQDRDHQQVDEGHLESGKTMIPTVSSVPIRIDPMSAPQRSPRPPMTTTTNDSMMTSVPTPGKTVRAGPASAPPKPASVAPKVTPA